MVPGEAVPSLPEMVMAKVFPMSPTAEVAETPVSALPIPGVMLPETVVASVPVKARALLDNISSRNGNRIIFRQSPACGCSYISSEGKQ